MLIHSFARRERTDDRGENVNGKLDGEPIKSDIKLQLHELPEGKRQARQGRIKFCAEGAR